METKWTIERTPCLKAVKCHDGYHYSVHDADGHDVVSVAANIKPEHAYAIRAIPDMREALRAVLLRFDLEPKEEVFPGSALREDIRAALALADGKAVPA